MSQKPPSDSFTRFTSTAPQSQSSRFSPNSSNPSSFTANTNRNPSLSQPPSATSPQTDGETPSQRVARLRAAHRANTTRNSLSPVDKLIARGRSFADIAHRVTTYSLLAITGISTVIAAYGIVSLVSHNRRQKRAWIEREMERLTDAQRAFLRGEANAEQLHLLEQERAGEEIARKFAEDKKRRKEEGVWARLKGTFGSFTGRGDMGIETVDRQQEIRDLGQQIEASQNGKETLTERGWSSDVLRPVAVQSGPVEGVGLDEKGRPVPINKVERIKAGRGTDAPTSVQGQLNRKPGALDVWADNAASKVTNTSQGWWSWVAGSSSSSTSSASPSTSTS